jgi:KTSC domain-containing protein
MVRAATALFLSLFAAPFTSETVDVRGRGAVDLKTFECRDINRSTIVQRVCYDAAGSTMLVAVRGAYHQFCSVPGETHAAFMDAPSMGLFFNRNVRTAASGDRYRCEALTAR